MKQNHGPSNTSLKYKFEKKKNTDYCEKSLKNLTAYHDEYNRKTKSFKL